MLSVSVIGAGSEAAGYANYQESEVAAAREDYYSAEGDAGRWTGKATQKMGLTGDLRPGQLLAGLQGFHPEAGEALSKNAGTKHKGGWDLTFSAPKSVSCVWAVIDPETRAAIESDQNAAAARALEFLEDSGAFISRSRTEPGPIEGIAAAMYLHGTSREADPQLHTHCAVLNLQPDGTAMDLDTRWKMAAGAVYRAELAAAMQKRGFQVEADGKSFRIAGVPEAVEKEFSTRRQQIEEALAAKGLKSAKAAEVAALSTRRGKEPTTRAELFQDWKARAATHGLDQETVQALRNTSGHELQHTPSPENGLDFIDQKKEQAHEQPDRYATDPERIRAAQLHGGLRQSNPAKIGIDAGVLRWAAFLVGIDPPPRARNHLRGLPELGMVRITDGSTVLLPRDVPDHVDQQTAERVDPLRRGGDGELDYSAILSAITQQASTFTPQQMAAAVAVEMQGKGDADAIQKALRDLKKHPDLIRLESEKPYHLRRGDPTEIRYTTR
ncbi:MAG: MobF family relaxase, partial [Thiobacillus sp.]